MWSPSLEIKHHPSLCSFEISNVILCVWLNAWAYNVIMSLHVCNEACMYMWMYHACMIAQLCKCVCSEKGLFFKTPSCIFELLSLNLHVRLNVQYYLHGIVECAI